MSESIFRKEKIPYVNNVPPMDTFDGTTKLLIKNHRSHDDGIPRAREYSLKSVINFSVYKGMTIKEIIEDDFDYFLWFARKIQNFTYDTNVLVYAEKCLLLLEKLSSPKSPISPKLNYAYEQVRIMLKYEYELDFGINPLLKDAYKTMVDVSFYKTIFNTPLEKLIRQKLTKFTYSPEYRRMYFEEIKQISKYNNGQKT